MCRCCGNRSAVGKLLVGNFIFGLVYLACGVTQLIFGIYFMLKLPIFRTGSNLWVGGLDIMIGLSIEVLLCCRPYSVSQHKMALCLTIFVVILNVGNLAVLEVIEWRLLLPPASVQAIVMEGKGAMLMQAYLGTTISTAVALVSAVAGTEYIYCIILTILTKYPEIASKNRMKFGTGRRPSWYDNVSCSWVFEPTDSCSNNRTWNRKTLTIPNIDITPLSPVETHDSEIGSPLPNGKLITDENCNTPLDSKSIADIINKVVIVEKEDLEDPRSALAHCINQSLPRQTKSNYSSSGYSSPDLVEQPIETEGRSYRNSAINKKRNSSLLGDVMEIVDNVLFNNSDEEYCSHQRDSGVPDSTLSRETIAPGLTELSVFKSSREEVLTKSHSLTFSSGGKSTVQLLNDASLCSSTPKKRRRHRNNFGSPGVARSIRFKAQTEVKHISPRLKYAVVRKPSTAKKFKIKGQLVYDLDSDEKITVQNTEVESTGSYGFDLNCNENVFCYEGQGSPKICNGVIPKTQRSGGSFDVPGRLHSEPVILGSSDKLDIRNAFSPVQIRSSLSFFPAADLQHSPCLRKALQQNMVLKQNNYSRMGTNGIPPNQLPKVSSPVLLHQSLNKSRGSNQIDVFYLDQNMLINPNKGDNATCFTQSYANLKQDAG